ncbi:MAG: hypothetical protein IPK75_17800 [Acidobacteria bacterium]|nr:hypothetical protein [Acidobacteriota bacterium]
MPHSARETYPAERPDATLEPTAAAVRAFGPPGHTELLLLTPSQVLALVGGKLIAYTTGQGDTLLLAYDD